VVFSLFIRCELAPQIVRLLVFWVLEVILPVCARLPDVDDCPWYTLFRVKVLDYAVHQRRLAVWMWTTNDGVPELAEGRVRRPERTEDRGRGRCLARLVDVLVCDLVD